jgi:tetratricopeptide (TPR) repeat protein
MAEAFAAQGMKEECEDCYLTAEKINKNHSTLYLSWGASLQKFEDYKTSLEKLNHACMLAPDDISIKYYQARAIRFLGDLPKAIQMLQLICRINTTDYNSITELGESYQATNEHKKAISCFNAVLKNTRNNHKLYYNIASSYRMMNQTSNAITYYEKTLEYYPEHLSALLELAEIQAKEDNFKEAIRRIRRAFQLEKENKDILFEYGKILMMANDLDNALEKINATLSLDPEYSVAYLCKAEIFIKKNSKEEAIALLDEVKEKFPEAIEVTNFLAFADIEIADVWGYFDYYHKAIEYLYKLIDQNYTNSTVLANLAYAKAKLGDKEGFRYEFVNLIHLYPNEKELILEYLDMAFEKLDFEADFGTLLKEEIMNYKAQAE